jgi:hypothetical protein
MKSVFVGALLLGIAQLSAAQGPQPSDQACAFTVSELEGALGAKLEAGRGSEMVFSGGKQLTCTYRGRGLVSVLLTQMRMDNPKVAQESYDRFKAGTMEPIAGDKDKARWQLGQGDLTNVTLHYLRSGTDYQVRVSGINSKDDRAVDSMRARVLTLRRLP